ncbi:MAG: hypothetical protein U0Y10_14150 [Spirosomataceae bacterium]
MKITPFELELYEKLSSFFTESGFVLLAEKKQFRKVTNLGFQNVIFSLSDYGNEVWLEVNFGLRHHEIEKIAQQFLGNAEEYRADANTLVISIGKFNNAKYFRYKMQTSSDLEDACEEIKRFLAHQGFPFLEAHQPLSELNRLFNTKPYSPCKYLYNQVHRCFKGIVAARLLSSDDFIDLSDQYRHQLVRIGASGEDLLNFEKMLSFLLYQSVN